MSWSSQFRNVLVALSLVALSAPEAQAIEIYGGTNATAQTNDDGIIQIRGGGGRGGGGMRHGGGGMHRGGGGMHRAGGGMHRGGGYAGGMHRGGGAYAGRGNVNRGNVNRTANRNVNRNTNRNVNRNVNGNINRAGYGYRGGAAWAGRPGWYRWPAGGAIAAGAALGWVTAASAASWAGAPPQAGLCWYYTDATQHQGFWDACP